MNNILFFDLEVDEKSKKITEIGSVLEEDVFRGTDLRKFELFADKASYVCGHNILTHDIPFLQKVGINQGFLQKPSIDTLYLSPLLFPNKPYHPLIKDYRLVSQYANDPVADSRLAQTLLLELINAWHNQSINLKEIFHSLLHRTSQFKAFFTILNDKDYQNDIISEQIKSHFKDSICSYSELDVLIKNHSIELAYALALISATDQNSIIPPWLLHQFPRLNEVLIQLRSSDCKKADCSYCREKLNPFSALKRFFNYDAFRKFENEGMVSLQEKAVRAALNQESLLVIFPTGGGKSLTFQLPALIKGEAKRALTVVISPLVSLMKDQVDVLANRFEIHQAVAINGLLSPLERAHAIERVQEGGACLLYISPESLRSRTIFNLLKGREIERFVIDEAHCFSSWGQDFRVDYLYIGRFLDKLRKEKNLLNLIPVSCFTATAKPAVVKDIVDYFKKTLNLDLTLFQTNAGRKNLNYFVYEANDDVIKLQKLKALLNQEEGPKIVYTARTKTCEKICEALVREGLSAKPYHGRMDINTKKKNQDDFMGGEVDIIVATTAFGMGVDKDNVKMVVHYDISDSLENYMQESGRAGRKPELQANCYILFNENDLNEHFSLLHSSKLNQKEVDQIWSAIKAYKRVHFTKSALEIAKAAGWDIEMRELETKVKAAIAALEDCGYLSRELNSTRVFAQSILVKSVEDANKILHENAWRFSEEELKAATRIFQNIISREETGADRISEVLGIPLETVSKCLNTFKELRLIGDSKDLTAYIDDSRGRKNSLKLFKTHSEIEVRLLDILLHENDDIHYRKVYLKELNEQLVQSGLEHSSIEQIRHILLYWKFQHHVEYERIDANTWLYEIQFKSDYSTLKKEIIERHSLAAAALEALLNQFRIKANRNDQGRQVMEFSVLELKQQAEHGSLFDYQQHNLHDYEKVLLYLHIIESIQLEGGLLIFYNPMQIQKLELEPRKRYTKQDYAKLHEHYEKRIEQIHIVGEYAKKQLQSHFEAMAFVNDYFTMEYAQFIRNYFPDQTGKLKQPITDSRFRAIFDSLSVQQTAVVKDNENTRVLVAAGPGSGKTRVLVHKVASLLMITDTKPEQFLMLTFSRPAAQEFKDRLSKLIGPAAYHVDISTYHSYAFNLLGRVGDLEKSEEVIPLATTAILNDEISNEKIASKTVIVVDEYQDIDQKQFEFLQAIIKKSNDPSVIVVGDDDQNIYEFRGSSVKYMHNFISEYGATVYYLDRNYRAKKNLVDFSNTFLQYLSNDRMKHDRTIVSETNDQGLIKLVNYRSSNLIVPAVNDILTSQLKGTIALLTFKNEDAILATSLLNERGRAAKLISSQDGFHLKDLCELRDFTKAVEEASGKSGLIEEVAWSSAKSYLNNVYKTSNKLSLALELILNFERINPKKFLSEWRTFLKESKAEDFVYPEEDTVIVSTMHKIKGKEFDNVFLLLNDFQLIDESNKRLVYVAITRAKDHLSIHTNMDYFNVFETDNLVKLSDTRVYPDPETIILQTGLTDVQLGFFKLSGVIPNINRLRSGEVISFDNLENLSAFRNQASKQISKLSSQYISKLSEYVQRGYKVKKSEVGYMVAWKCLDDGNEYKVVLPKLWLSK